MAILNIDEAAKYLRMSRRSLESLISRREVPCTKLGGRWVFSQEQLLKAVEEKCADNKEPAQQKRLVGTRRKRNAVPSV